MDGLLAIDKPTGPTSHDVVARVRRATGWTRVGHTGTLDPLATGVLPLVVGRATRLARFFSASEKEYEAEIRLGWATDTFDAEGTPVGMDGAYGGGPTVSGAPDDVALPSAERIVRALDGFRGTIVQVPPRFSAKKIDGVRAYVLARTGRDVAPKGVEVVAHEIVLLSFDGERVRVRIRCSAGFYVRAFAHDLGVVLGTGAHLSELRRTRSGDVDLARAVPLAEVEALGANAATHVVPMSRLLPTLPAAVVNQEGAERARHGRDLGLPHLLSDAPPAPWVKIVDERGDLLAVARSSSAEGMILHPGIVVG